MSESRQEPELSFARRVALAAHVSMEELEGEAVLLNIESGLYLGLNRSGTEILAELTRQPSVEAAYRELLTEYEVDPDTLRSELGRFLGELVEQGIVELVDP